MADCGIIMMILKIGDLVRCPLIINEWILIEGDMIGRQATFTDSFIDIFKWKRNEFIRIGLQFSS